MCFGSVFLGGSITRRLQLLLVEFSGGRSHKRAPTPRLQTLTEIVVVAISGIGQNHAAQPIFLDQRTNLFESDLRLGLETDLCRDAGPSAPLAVVGPYLRQIVPVSGRKAGLFGGGQRNTDGDAAVLLLAQ